MHTMVVQMSIDPSRAHVVTRHLREDIVSWARQQAGIHQRPVAAGPGPKPRHGRRCLRLRARRHSRGARPTQLPPRPRPGLERRGRDRLRAGHLRLTAHRPARPVCEATGDVRRVSRFPGRDHFAAYSCTAPNRGVLGRPESPPAVAARQPPAQPRDPPGRGYPDPYRHSPGRAYYGKKLAQGKTPKEVLRALKCDISGAIFACLQADARCASAATAKSPGWQPGNGSASSAAGSHPAPPVWASPRNVETSPDT